jgi:hypothetical protein
LVPFKFGALPVIRGKTIGGWVQLADFPTFSISFRARLMTADDGRALRFFGAERQVRVPYMREM